MQYWVYILKSERDGSFYIGYTTDLPRRLEEHNSGKSIYSRRKSPWRIVYSEIYATKREALIRERFLKAQRNRSFYEFLSKGN